MARRDWESIAESRRPQAPAIPVPREAEQRPRVPGERLRSDERRALMLRVAEQKGIETEVGAMLSLVRAVEGFTNMSAVYKVPDRAMIDAERVRGARTEGQARGRAWGRLHEQQKMLDSEMQESGTGYVRPSDWFRLFAALKKATKPDGNIPNVFAVETAADRSVFRAWAGRYGLDGDGLVRVGKMLRDEHQSSARAPFDVEAFIGKIQAFTPEQLHEVIRAGFENEDIYVRSDEGNSIPLEQLPNRYNETQKRVRLSVIGAETDRLVRSAPPLGSASDAKDLRNQKYTEASETYDAQHFGAVTVDRSSAGYEYGIASNVFASIESGKGGHTGYGYHGIIEPELIRALPKGYLYEERGRPYVRSRDGKTVVHVQRWLMNTGGVGLMPVEEAVQGEQVATLEQAATREIANAIVYKVRGNSRSGVGFREEILEPFFWNDVHWVYKKLVEDRLPLLAKLAGVDPGPLDAFAGEDGEKEWMFNQILSSGVTTSKQLNDKRSHFELTIDDVFIQESDRAPLREAEKRYPETIPLGKHPFVVKYEWDPSGKTIARATVDIERGSGAFANAFWLERATPAEVPSLGTEKNPVPIVFRFQEASHGFRDPVQEFPGNRFRELLEILQPQERFLSQAWRDFSAQNPVGKMDIPLTVTSQDAFPTPAQLGILMAPNQESVVYVVDRDGVKHLAYATIQYAEGDEYRIRYAQNQQSAEADLAHAKEKHAQRVAALRSREAMGGDALNEKLKDVRALQAEIDGYTSEFEADNLVAFVLGRPPFSEDDQRYVKSCLDDNEIRHAETALKNRIYDRTNAQPTVDAMRKVSATITELEALGFDWRRYDFNKRNREFDYEYGSSRRDHDGFQSGDIRLHKAEIYRPTMGRIVGHRVDSWRLQQELPNLQRKLDSELERWKMKKGELRDERSRNRADSDEAVSGPEVVHRGFSDSDEDDDEY